MNASHSTITAGNADAVSLIKAALDMLGQGQSDPKMAQGDRSDLSRIDRPWHLAKLAEQLYRARAARAETWDMGLFGEPAWDIMLDLFVQKQKNNRVSVTSACIGSGVPSTTALRWITILVEQGLVERVEDPMDRRRAFVELTKEGYSRLYKYLDAVEAKLAVI